MVISSGRPEDGLILRRHFEGNESWLEVMLAEPEALFAGELLRDIRKGQADLGVTLTKAEIGGILRIEAKNRTVVYRLVAHTDHDVFVGHWPD